MKTIEVVAAVIFDEQGRIFATQRGYGEWKDWWEFPGGKIEAGETPQQALKREIHEELDAEIEVGELLRTIDYDYPTFHLTMHCFKCKLAGGHVTLKEHEAAKWLAPQNLDSVKWLPADEEIINELKTQTMPCPHNHIDCPCTKEGCPRHGKCCECVAHHKEHGTKLPACLRGIDWEK